MEKKINFGFIKKQEVDNQNVEVEVKEVKAEEIDMVVNIEVERLVPFKDHFFKLHTGWC